VRILFISKVKLKENMKIRSQSQIKSRNIFENEILNTNQMSPLRKSKLIYKTLEPNFLPYKA